MADPPGGDTTSCTWPAPTGTIVRLTAHMHLLGQGMKFVLDAGTPNAKTLLDITNYNFDYQRSYDIASITTKPGDTIQVTCTYNPTLRQELPATAQAPAPLRRLGRRLVGRDVPRPGELRVHLQRPLYLRIRTRRRPPSGRGGSRPDDGRQDEADRATHHHVGDGVVVGRLGVHDDHTGPRQMGAGNESGRGVDR